jgi:hypothetical protein
LLFQRRQVDHWRILLASLNTVTARRRSGTRPSSS